LTTNDPTTELVATVIYQGTLSEEEYGRTGSNFADLLIHMVLAHYDYLDRVRNRVKVESYQEKIGFSDTCLTVKVWAWLDRTDQALFAIQGEIE